MSAVIDAQLRQPFGEAKPIPPPSLYTSAWSAFLVCLDAVSFAGAAYAAAVLTIPPESHGFGGRLLLSSIIFIALWIAIFARVGLYRRTFAMSLKDEVYFIVAALFMGIVPQLTLFTLVPSISTSRLQLLVALGFAAIAVSLVRIFARACRSIALSNRPRRIAVVGTAERVAAVTASLNLVPGSQVLRLDVEDLDANIPVDLGNDPELDRIEWLRRAKAWQSETLFLTEVLPPHLMPHLLEVAARRHMKVAFAPPRVQFHAYGLSLEQDGRQALIVPSQLRSCQPSSKLIKRITDLVAAVAGLALLSPIMALACLAVFLESGRPILYRQRRVGRNGVEFDLLKFRSMPPDAEAASGPVWASPADGRATRIGAFLRRTSIDELPQLFNVLRGDMSIVGPRPERPMFVERFRQNLPRYDERHLMRPGITGWSQVHMRRVLQPSEAGEKLSYDLFYIEQWGFILDAYVVCKTAAEFLFHRAA